MTSPCLTQWCLLLSLCAWHASVWDLGSLLPSTYSRGAAHAPPPLRARVAYRLPRSIRRLLHPLPAVASI
jgi:hypothetical protein